MTGKLYVMSNGKKQDPATLHLHTQETAENTGVKLKEKQAAL